MSKPKYEKGNRITSLDELATSEFVFIGDKVQHFRWFGFWRLTDAANHVKNGNIYEAVLIARKEK